MPDERNLTRAEARVVARDIADSGLVEEWEARAAAYNRAVTEFKGWLQDLPSFPASAAGRWAFYPGALDIAEELVAMLRRESR